MKIVGFTWKCAILSSMCRFFEVDFLKNCIKHFLSVENSVCRTKKEKNGNLNTVHILNDKTGLVRDISPPGNHCDPNYPAQMAIISDNSYIFFCTTANEFLSLKLSVPMLSLLSVFHTAVF